jgi:hypothetical protein
MKLTLSAAMRARDVSRPLPEDPDDEAPDETDGKDGTGQEDGSGGSSPVFS